MSTQKLESKSRLPLNAKTVDLLALYEDAVQDTKSEIRFFRRVFVKRHQREPLSLREDFCGTAKLCADWVRGNPHKTAVGVDLSPQVLDYARRHHLAKLGPDATRVKLCQQDVRDKTEGCFDVIVAFNFSYSVFKTREVLGEYFKNALCGLKAGGAFFIDLYGGPSAQEECYEIQRRKGYDYIWEQEPLDAINATGKRYIHFRFRDGSQIKRAFVYDWRLWNLTEIRELLLDVGFSKVDVYWEGATDRGEGNGILRLANKAINEESFIAYLVAWN